MKSKTTIYDIAKRLNITAATVSRALNDNPRISKKTKQLVIETAEKMNYEPNKLAVALKNGKSNNVGVVVPYINRNFFSSAIRGIEEELYPEGYNVIICQSHDKKDREQKIIKNLLKSQVEGIIISRAGFSKDVKHYKEVLNKNVPLIFFDRKADIKKTSSVTINDYQASYDATKHLIDQGKKRIAHLTVDLSLELYANRLKGLKAAIADAGLKFNKKLIVSMKSDIEEGKKAAQKLMSLAKPPDAIFSASDHGALGAINWLKKEGHNIPLDIAVVGFSNEPFTQFMEMPISSIDQKPLEMGKMAAQIFIRQTKSTSKRKKNENIVLEPELIQRASSLS